MFEGDDLLKLGLVVDMKDLLLNYFDVGEAVGVFGAETGGSGVLIVLVVAWGDPISLFLFDLVFGQLHP